MNCTARYEKCTGKVTNFKLGYCQACLDMEVYYHRRRISELKCEIDQHEKSLLSLGVPGPKVAVTIHPGGRVEQWSSRTGRRPQDDMPADQYPPNGLLCVECRQPQYETNGGACCMNGHGGAPGVEP